MFYVSKVQRQIALRRVIKFISARTKPMLILGPSTLIAGRHSSFNCSVQSPSFQDAKFDWIVSQKVVKIESSKTSSVITIEATEGKMSENIQCKAWNKKNETIRDTKCLEIQCKDNRACKLSKFILKNFSFQFHLVELTCFMKSLRTFFHSPATHLQVIPSRRLLGTSTEMIQKHSKPKLAISRTKKVSQHDQSLKWSLRRTCLN